MTTKQKEEFRFHVRVKRHSRITVWRRRIDYITGRLDHYADEVLVPAKGHGRIVARYAFKRQAEGFACRHPRLEVIDTWDVHDKRLKRLKRLNRRRKAVA